MTLPQTGWLQTLWQRALRRLARLDPDWRVESAFHNSHYLALTARSLEHLASLALPLAGRTVLEVGAGAGDYSGFFLERGCRLSITDARPELLAYLRRRYPKLSGALLDLDRPGPLAGAPFEVVMCYGVLYHLQDPAGALAYLSANCSSLLLVSSQVVPAADASFRQIAESRASLSQSYYGVGSRFTRRWLYDQLHLHFPYVYLPLNQPAHPQFPCDWDALVEVKDIVRANFVASRTPLDNPALTLEWLDHQTRQA